MKRQQPLVMSRTMTLESGGTITLAASLDVFLLNPKDRAFVFSMIDQFDDYGGSPAAVEPRRGRKPRATPKPERKPAPVPRPAKPPRPTRAPTRIAAPDAGVSPLIAARDQAILESLRRGAKNTVDLRAVLPAEPGQTEEQRERACSNALTRLRMKGQIKPVDGGGWALA